MINKIKRPLLFILIILFFLPNYSDAIKIATWKILNFPGTTGANRIDDFQKVLDELDLDILVVQEMLNQQGVNEFLNKVLNYKAPKLFKKAPFFDGPDTDNAAFYNKKTIKLISHQQISTALRDISEYYFKIKKGPGKRTKFRLYSVHLKAGTSSSDKKKREDEAKVLRDYLNTLPSDSLFVVSGDFNIYTNTEEAFNVLTGIQNDNDGRVKDPIDMVGNWHDNKKYKNIHSQSTRKTQFGGGASGGLDDRFDMFLISYGLDNSTKLTYKPDSYVVYGNDGKHLNKAINKPKNKIVSKKIANALHEASDHLPVIIELEPPTERNYRQDMRNFVQGISAYAKGIKTDFIVIPQNGHELLTEDGEKKGTPAAEYLNAINGVGREDLFYGYDEDNVPTPASERNYMLAFMDIAESNSVDVLVTDYCSTQSYMDDSYNQSNTRGYISFAADHRELDNIPAYPPNPFNVNTLNITSLAEAMNFLYLINPGLYSDKDAFLNAIRDTDYDIFIIDLFYDDPKALTASEISSLKVKANGSTRLIIAYMSIGEAENYRYYWQSKWEANPPSWLVEENPDWPGNYKVRYWDKNWQNIIYGNDDSYLKKILDAGFDGVYLDIIDAYEYFEPSSD